MSLSKGDSIQLTDISKLETTKGETEEIYIDSITDEENQGRSTYLKYGADEIIDEDCDDSPIPEVRTVVDPTDDYELPVNTGRMWFLGVICTIIGAGVNQFFSMRYPGVTISSLVAQLVVFPIGVALAKALPIWNITIGRFKIPINPDHTFNVKEHAMITIMANISFTSAWATDVIQAQVAFYGVEAKAGYQILLVLTCQLFGLGIAGLCEDFLVKPSKMYWPATLANIALFKSMHSKENHVADKWKITRMKFFLIVFISSFVYYWFPGFIFTALSYFTWICWIVPNNVVVNQVFGQIQGLGVFPLTFDWAQIAYNGSPLITPLSAQLNTLLGVFIFIWIMTPALYYQNAFYSAYLPISSSNVFDNTGAEYDGAKIIDSTGRMVESIYKSYSQPFLAITYAIAYGTSYAVLTAGPLYALLYHGKDIWAAFKGRSKKDIHVRLMERYPSVPKWWYILLTILVFAVTCVIMEVYKTQWPIWGIVVALLMVIVFVLPIGLVYGNTNINTNNMTTLGQMISGYALPGLPIVALTFKFYAYTGVSQALAFASDMKVGYYMKIPKRTIFWGQFISCVIGAFVQVGIVIFMLGNVKDICSSDQADGFTCPQGRTNFAASIVWGAVGPKKMFGIGGFYSKFLHLFWIGPLLVFITWVLHKKFPNNSIFKNLNWVVVFGGLGNFPPATGINYTSAIFVAVIFNYFIRKRFPAWWDKYLYVLSCALDVGVALAGIIIFFAVSYPGYSLSWWGNEVYNDTADGLGTAFLPLPSKGYFGPDSWS